MTCMFETNPPAPTCKNGPCQICVEVAKVDEEINQTVTTLQRQSLHAKRYDLRSEQNRAHDLMHRLPLELKSYIFELVLLTRDEWGRTSRGKTPPYLTSICRGWRDIAWSIPSLWSTIPIVLGTPSTPDSSWENFVHDWILRSRTLPLTLHFRVSSHGLGDDLEDDLEDQLYGVLEVMSQFPNEWESLSLDIPFSSLHILNDSDSDFQSHLLTVKTLRIICSGRCDAIDKPVPPSNPKMSPEKIEILNLSFHSLRISWNHLTYATVGGWELGEITQLFQHASQMTYCNILFIPQPLRAPMSPIIHRRLQTLKLACTGYQEINLVLLLLNTITLPCLHDIGTDLGVAANIPALVHRSSCPLTRITFYGAGETECLRDLRPLPGVTDLVLAIAIGERDKAVLKKFLLEGYFPDLRHLTFLRFGDFLLLWDEGIIPILLGSRYDAPNETTLRKVFVQGAPMSHHMWNSQCGRQVKALQSSIIWKEDCFEILIPALDSLDVFWGRLLSWTDV